MRAALANIQEQIRGSLWFVPALCVVGAVGLSSALLAIDGRLGPDVPQRVPWLFGGTAQAGRTLLQTVASSLITVVAVAFSVTLLAVQQAASRYTPRVLHTFRRDRRNHVVLGTYIGTFTYALLVMRQIREPDADNGEFVPAIAISAAIVLALISLGMLVYFIHHIVRSFHGTWIVTSIRDEAVAAIDEMFPATIGRPVRPWTPATTVEERGAQEGRIRGRITAPHAGYLRRIDDESLTRAVEGRADVVHVQRWIGDFVMHGEVLATVWSERPLPDELEQRAREAFILGRERSMEQDPLFAIRQLVDIAVKALSPGVNDPTTAEEALTQLAEVIAVVAERDFPAPVRRTNRAPIYRFESPNFEDYVDAAFGQVRRAARDDLHVTLTIVTFLARLAGRAADAARRGPLVVEIDAILRDLETSGLADADRGRVRAHATALLSHAADTVSGRAA